MPSVTHTTDSLLKAIGLTEDHNTDSILKKIGAIVAHTTDSMLNVVNTVTHTTDSYLATKPIQVHSTDSVLKKLANLVIHSTDSHLRIVDIELSHMSDSVLKCLGIFGKFGAFLSTFIDSITTDLGWTTNTSSITIDQPDTNEIRALNLNGAGGAFDEHAFKDFSVVGRFGKLIQGSFKLEFEMTITSTSNPGLAPRGHWFFLMNVNTHPDSTVGENKISLLWLNGSGGGNPPGARLGIDDGTTSSVCTIIDIPIDANKKYFRIELDESTRVLTLSVFSDLARTIHLTGSPQSVVVDVLIDISTLALQYYGLAGSRNATSSRGWTGSEDEFNFFDFFPQVCIADHTTDSILKKLGSATPNHTTDSILRILNNLRTHTTDSILKAITSITHTSDSFLVLVTSRTNLHTTDSVLKKLANTVSHSTDSYLEVFGGLISKEVSADLCVTEETTEDLCRTDESEVDLCA